MSSAALTDSDIWPSDDPEFAQVERNIEGWTTAQVRSPFHTFPKTPSLS